MTFEETLKIALYTAGLTFAANFIFSFLKVKFNLFEENTVFRKKHSYEQLCNLYFDLYSIVSQSEYLRYFHDIDADFEDEPFIQVSKKQSLIRQNAKKERNQFKQSLKLTILMQLLNLTKKT